MGDEHALSIGAVTRITGIPGDTLRTWERRYQVVVPRRDEAGRRTYSPAQVERLRRILALTERGERVSELATLSDAVLEERVRLHEPASTGELEVVSAAVLHGVGTDLGGVAEDGRRLEVAWSGDVDDVAAVPAGLHVVVVDLDALGPHPETALQELIRVAQPSGVVLTYHYVSRADRKRLSLPRVRLEQAPLAVRSLRRIALDHARQTVGRSEAPDAPAPRFTRPELEQLLNIRPDLACECPNHIAGIVLMMREFESYSRRCANATAEDAALHAELANGTAIARASMEQLLARVLAHDGIELG